MNSIEGDPIGGGYPLDVELVSAVKHPNFCDECFSYPIRGYFYLCKSCVDYGLCNSCFTTIPHPHSEHEFFTIPDSKWSIHYEQKVV
jgi:hypothetical protein